MLVQQITPIVQYKHEEYLLPAPQISSVPNKILVNRVGFLAHIRAAIISSLAFVDIEI